MNMTCKYIQGKMWLSVLTVSFYKTEYKSLEAMVRIHTNNPELNLVLRRYAINVIFKKELNVYTSESCPNHYDKLQFSYSGMTILIEDAIISYNRIDEHGRLVLELQAKELLILKNK